MRLKFRELKVEFSLDLGKSTSDTKFQTRNDRINNGVFFLFANAEGLGLDIKLLED